MLARKGAEAVKQKTPTPRRSRAHFHAMEAVNMDGHQCNVFVKFEDGTVTRPMLVGIQDLCSGLFVSTRVDRSENWHIVRLAIGDMVRDYGIPEHIYLDNGRAFAAKGITGRVPNRFRFKVRKEDPQGLLPSLGVNVHWTLPYNGRAKPIERAWREISERIAKHPICEGAYTGPNVTAKPENYGSKAVPIAQFRQLVADEIAFFNAREGRRTETAAGRSYLATFNESMALPTTLVKCPTLEQTRLWLLAAESQKVRTHTGEMVLYGNRFHHPALADHRGQTMTVRFDPDALHGSVHLYLPSGAYLCEADCIAAVGFDDVEAARASARNQQAYLKANRALLDATDRMSIDELIGVTPRPSKTTKPERSNVERLPTGAPAKRRAAAGGGFTDDDFSSFDRALDQMGTGDVLAFPARKAGD